MLVLTRKPAETIRIGEDIVIKVIKTGKGTVKIGIEAPANVRVMRGELEVDNAVPVIPANFGRRCEWSLTSILMLPDATRQTQLKPSDSFQHTSFFSFERTGLRRKGI